MFQLFVGKFVHNTIIDCITRLNQTNINSFFFTHRVLQSLLVIQQTIRHFLWRKENGCKRNSRCGIIRGGNVHLRDDFKLPSGYV